MFCVVSDRWLFGSMGTPLAFTNVMLHPPASILGLLPSPSKVRALLLVQHEELRELVLEADRLARHVQEGQMLHLESMRAAALLVATALSAHIDAEEGLALPLLRDIDAWGPVRAQNMMEEHEAQRAAVAVLRQLEERGDCAELARGLRALVQTLLCDMRREESELLGKDLLRDDVVAVDQTDG
jgi:hypothetical protein